MLSFDNWEIVLASDEDLKGDSRKGINKKIVTWILEYLNTYLNYYYSKDDPWLEWQDSRMNFVTCDWARDQIACLIFY